MTREDLVLVDTCVWAAFFSRSTSAEKNEVMSLLKRDRIAIIGPIKFEVLVGFRRADEANWVGSRLADLNHLDIADEDWRKAARLGSNLSSKGHKIPMTDLVISVVAKRFDFSVFTIDPHFTLIPRLKLYGH